MASEPVTDLARMAQETAEDSDVGVTISYDDGFSGKQMKAKQVRALATEVLAARARIAELEAEVLAAEWEGSDACAMPVCPFCRRDQPSSWPDVIGDYEPHDPDCIVRKVRTAKAPSGEETR